MIRILFIGDIVGHGGREAAKQLTPQLRREFAVDFCVANGENMAGGNGMTKPLILEFAPNSVDVFTSGDHVWDQREFPGQIESLSNVLRPANLPTAQPGRGWAIFSLENGLKIGVVNLLGRTFIGIPSDNPFSAAEVAIQAIRKETSVILVDFHAEATSEKIAMGRFLDGKVSAVFGTHTHVPTADTQIFPGGTAFQCDTGMVGSRESILGREIAPVLERFTTGMPTRFTVNESSITLNGILVDIDEQTGHALTLERISKDFS